MSGMVQIALAEDATEAEEIQALLEDAGIESEVQSDDDSDSLKVFVAEAAVEAAQDVIEPPTDPDEPDRGAVARYSRTNSSLVEPTRPGLTSSKTHSERPSASGGEGTLPFQTAPEATCGRAQVIPFTLSSIGVPCLPSSVSSSRPRPQA